MFYNYFFFRFSRECITVAKEFLNIKGYMDSPCDLQTSQKAENITERKKDGPIAMALRKIL